MRSGRRTDRLDQGLGCLIGGGVGILLVSCLAIAGLVLLPESTSPEPMPAPGAYDIEAIVEEDYINNSMGESTTGLPAPIPVLAAHFDVRPGGQGDFVAKVMLGPIEPVIRGTVTLRPTADGRLEVDLTDVRLGYLPVTALIPSGPLDDMNIAVNEMMAQRMGPMEARLVAVGGDETTLRFYMVADL